MKAKNPVTLFTSNLAEIEIFYRNKVKMTDMEKVCGSRDVYEVLQRIWSPKIDYVEEFMVLGTQQSKSCPGMGKDKPGRLVRNSGRS